MTITLDLTPEVESQLQEEASRHGQDAAQYLTVLLTEMFRSGGRSPQSMVSPREWAKAFREWAAEHDTTTPPIPLEALRREHLYEDRGL